MDLKQETYGTGTLARFVIKKIRVRSYMESFVKLQPITSMKNVLGLRAM